MKNRPVLSLYGAAIFIKNIAGQVYFIIPENTGAAFIHLYLLKQAGHFPKQLITGQGHVFLHIIDNFFEGSLSIDKWGYISDNVGGGRFPPKAKSAVKVKKSNAEKGFSTRKQGA